MHNKFEYLAYISLKQLYSNKRIKRLSSINNVLKEVYKAYNVGYWDVKKKF